MAKPFLPIELRCFSLGVVLPWVLISAGAAAQKYTPGSAAAATVSASLAESSVPVVEYEEDTSKSFEVGAELGVPVFIDQSVKFSRKQSDGSRYPNGQIDVGVGLLARLAVTIRNSLSIEGLIGIQSHGVNDFADDASLTGLNFGLGARYSFYNDSALVPFVAAGLFVNTWNLRFTNANAEAQSDTQAGFGFRASVGALYETNKDFAIELGAHLNHQLSGGHFDQPLTWTTPFIGGIFYW